MRLLLVGLFGLWAVSPAFGQEEDAPEPDDESRTFDVFDLPEGEVPAPERGPPPPPPPPVSTTITASAATGPRVLVLLAADSEDATVAERIGDETAAQLAKARGLFPLTTRAALDPSAGRTKRQEIQIGRKGIDDGLLAFEELDLETAGAELEVSISVLAAYFGELPPPARETLARGIFAYAATTLFEGLSEQADAIFVALALLEPGFSPVEDRYPSNVIERFAELKTELETRPVGALTVKTNPPGASVSVDGVFRGSSPVTVAGLADGYHVVTASRIGFRPIGTLAPVTGETSATVDLELDLSEDVSRIQRLSSSLAFDRPAAKLFKEELGVDYMAVLSLNRRLSGTVVEGIWLGPNGALLGEIAPLDIVDDPEVASRSIAAAFTAAENARLAALAPPPRAEEPLVDRWWFWAAVSGAVVAVAAGTAAAVVATSGDRPPPNTAIFGF